MLQNSLRISSVCSPNKGERLTTAGESDNLIGFPTVKYLPLTGWSTSTTVPVSLKPGSSAISFNERMGHTGISRGLHTSITSNFVLVIVQASIVLKISFKRGNRSAGVE